MRRWKFIVQGSFYSRILIFVVSVFLSCVHESLAPEIETPDPDPDPQEEECDPDVVYFENDILPILVSNCAKPGCHNSETAEEGIVLNSYRNIMNSDVIEPGDPGDSELYEKITEDDHDDIMPPPPNTRLTSEQIGKIRQWIRDGAENNACASAVCKTTNVTFSGSIRPLINNTCVGCHSGSAPSGGLNFTTYSGLRVPALDGRLLGAVSHAGGFTPMPLGGNKLSQCHIDMIRIWVEGGAQNN